MAPVTSSFFSLDSSSTTTIVTSIYTGSDTHYDNSTAHLFDLSTSEISPRLQIIVLIFLALILGFLVFVINCLMARSFREGRRRHAAQLEATVRKVQREMITNPSTPTVNPPDYAPHLKSMTLEPDIAKAIDDQVLSVLETGIILSDVDLMNSEEGEPSDFNKNHWSFGDPRGWSGFSKSSGCIGEGSSSALENYDVSSPAYDEDDIGEVDLNNSQGEIFESKFTMQRESEE